MDFNLRLWSARPRCVRAVMRSIFVEPPFACSNAWDCCRKCSGCKRASARSRLSIGITTRSLAFGEEANFVRYLGYYVSIFTIPNYLDLDRSGVYYGTLGKKVGIFSGGDA